MASTTFIVSELRSNFVNKTNKNIPPLQKGYCKDNERSSKQHDPNDLRERQRRWHNNGKNHN
ncbi:hypothetical protein PPTG_23632 [Phytophthora nicotianae INRA-310]|uniref:Uncharacterized protein n=2 Tax=Phytophthora nicotianae TaxID=4792 RepID=W2PU76_PHYN3|nr:hypothetical protein PPTG_23632 [Phytophthora nicotianae INRA-310]ETM39666.1 hypothetical protein L914_14192 [Phytophthora nicotianae]ETN04176.1 hypothetical protein PPTG_23632 [Phytophthora nicotianae INRA-310]